MVECRVARTYDARRPEKGAEKYADVSGFCRSAAKKEITAHGNILTPRRYVGAEEVQDDGEPFEEKMAPLAGRRTEQFAKSNELEKLIRDSLKSLGYGR